MLRLDKKNSRIDNYSCSNLLTFQGLSELIEWSYFMLLFCFSVDGGNAVGKIIFLKARAMKKDAATLVASGPQGTTICYRTNLSHSSLGPR